jgi:phosphoglycolate phosphatase
MKLSNDILIFDFDGTIADTLHHLVAIGNRLSDEFNFRRIETHEIDDLKGKTAMEITHHLQVPFLKIPAIVARARKELNQNIHSIEIVEGLEKVLTDLKALGHQIGILTTNSANNVHQFLENHRIDVFDFISTTPQVWGKAASLTKLIQKNNFRAEQVVYVGDETRDIEAAKKAGVRVAAVTWGYNSRGVLKAHQPDYLIHHPNELMRIGTVEHSPLER